MDISVIIPIYNAEEYLVECLESVRRNIAGLQAEVLLVDDGSTDCSPVIARLYAEKLESFTYYRTENSGFGCARNYGVTKAKGKYLFFVDSGDMLADGILKKMLETAERNGTELTVCHVARYSNKKAIGSYLHLRAFQGLREPVSLLTKHPDFIYDSTIWNKLILRSFFLKQKITFPEGYTCEDMLPVFILYSRCNRVSVLRVTGYLWRVRTESGKQPAQSNIRKTLREVIEMMTRTLEYARTFPVSPEILEALEIKILSCDFAGWFDRFRLLPLNEAVEQAALIRKFIAEHINKESVGRIPLIWQQIYQDLFREDWKHLLMVINYKNTNYSRVPVIEHDGNPELRLPVPLFTIESRSAVHEFGNYILPESQIYSVTTAGNCVSLVGQFYIKRASIPFDCTEYFQAVLSHETGRCTVPLPVSPVRRPGLTEAQGNVLNYDDYQYYGYNYDGAGFQIDLDFEAFSQQQELAGTCSIILAFAFPHCSGHWLLKGISGNAKKVAEKFIYKGKEYTGRITFDAQNILQILLEKKEDKTAENPGTDLLRKIPPAFSGTTAGKQLMKLQQDNQKLKKEKEKIQKEKEKIQKEKIQIQKEKIKIQKELSSIKVSRGFKVLNRYYHVRDSIRKGFTGFLSERETALEKGIPAAKRVTTSDRRVTLINYWTADPVICNRDWLYRFIKNNTDIKHVNVFSVFGKKEYVEKYATKKDVFFSGENLDVKHGLYDEYGDYCLDYVGLSLGFAQRKEANYQRLPLWMLWIFDPVIDKDKIAERVRLINQARNTGKYECSLIARHDKWNMRTPIYEALKDNIRILCAGKWNNNTSVLWDEYKDNKVRFLQDCKFTICAENEDTPYYVTEKLFEAFLGGSIPIYAGACSKPEPGIINPDAVLLWKRGDRENNVAVIKKVCELNQNRELYEEFLSRKKLLPGTVDYVYDRFVLLKAKLSELR